MRSTLIKNKPTIPDIIITMAWDILSSFLDFNAFSRSKAFSKLHWHIVAQIAKCKLQCMPEFLLHERVLKKPTIPSQKTVFHL